MGRLTSFFCFTNPLLSSTSLFTMMSGVIFFFVSNFFCRSLDTTTPPLPMHHWSIALQSLLPGQPGRDCLWIADAASTSTAASSRERQATLCLPLSSCELSHIDSHPCLAVTSWIPPQISIPLGWCFSSDVVVKILQRESEKIASILKSLACRTQWGRAEADMETTFPLHAAKCNSPNM